MNRKLVFGLSLLFLLLLPASAFAVDFDKTQPVDGDYIADNAAGGESVGLGYGVRSDYTGDACSIVEYPDGSTSIISQHSYTNTGSFVYWSDSASLSYDDYEWYVQFSNTSDCASGWSWSSSKTSFYYHRLDLSLNADYDDDTAPDEYLAEYGTAKTGFDGTIVLYGDRNGNIDTRCSFITPATDYTPTCTVPAADKDTWSFLVQFNLQPSDPDGDNTPVNGRSIGWSSDINIYGPDLFLNNPNDGENIVYDDSTGSNQGVVQDYGGTVYEDGDIDMKVNGDIEGYIDINEESEEGTQQSADTEPYLPPGSHTSTVTFDPDDNNGGGGDVTHNWELGNLNPFNDYPIDNFYTSATSINFQYGIDSDQYSSSDVGNLDLIVDGTYKDSCSFSSDTITYCSSGISLSEGHHTWHVEVSGTSPEEPSTSNRDLYIDTSPPDSDITPDGTAWQDTDQSYSISCSDTGVAGCDTTYWEEVPDGTSCPSQGNFANSGSPTIPDSITCSAGSICEQDVCYYSKDKVPNTESTERSGTFQIDKADPTTSIDSPSGGTWQTSDFSVSTSDSDQIDGSGLDVCEYHIDKDNDGTYEVGWTSRICDESFTVTVGSSGYCSVQGEDKCVVEIRATDNTGNYVSDSSTYSIDYDGSPYTSISSPASGTWQTGNFDVTYNVSDGSCPGSTNCDLTLYTNDGGAGWVDRGSPDGGWTSGETSDDTTTIDVGSSGWCSSQGTDTCQVKIEATDPINPTASSSRSFSIDYKNPSVSINLPSPSSWHKDNFDVDYDITDANCPGSAGCDLTLYTKDGTGSWIDRGSPDDGWGDGNTTIQVGSTGWCSSQGTDTCQVKFNATDPTSFNSSSRSFSIDYETPDVSIKSPALGTWQTEDFNISYNISDISCPGSTGCDLTLYTENGTGSWIDRGSPDDGWNTDGKTTIQVGSSGWCSVEGSNKCQVEFNASDAVELKNSSSRSFSIDYKTPFYSNVNDTAGADRRVERGVIVDVFAYWEDLTSYLNKSYFYHNKSGSWLPAESIKDFGNVYSGWHNDSIDTSGMTGLPKEVCWKQKCEDIRGNLNSSMGTYGDPCFTVVEDATPPKYWKASDDSGGAVPLGVLANVSVFWNDSASDLYEGETYHNGTGDWKNVDNHTFPADTSAAWYNYSIDTSGFAGETLCWKQYASDDPGNWNKTMPNDSYCFRVYGPPIMNSIETYINKSKRLPTFYQTNGFLDGTGLHVTKSSEGINIRANITDFEGRDDINSVLVSVRNTLGYLKVNNQSMTAVENITVNGIEGKQYWYNYSIPDDAEPGKWNITVWSDDYSTGMWSRNSTNFYIGDFVGKTLDVIGYEPEQEEFPRINHTVNWTRMLKVENLINTEFINVSFNTTIPSQALSSTVRLENEGGGTTKVNKLDLTTRPGSVQFSANFTADETRNWNMKYNTTKIRVSTKGYFEAGKYIKEVYLNTTSSLDGLGDDCTVYCDVVAYGSIPYDADVKSFKLFDEKTDEEVTLDSRYTPPGPYKAPTSTKKDKNIIYVNWSMPSLEGARNFTVQGLRVLITVNKTQLSRPVESRDSVKWLYNVTVNNQVDDLIDYSKSISIPVGSTEHKIDDIPVEVYYGGRGPYLKLTGEIDPEATHYRKITLFTEPVVISVRPRDFPDRFWAGRMARVVRDMKVTNFAPVKIKDIYEFIEIPYGEQAKLYKEGRLKKEIGEIRESYRFQVPYMKPGLSKDYTLTYLIDTTSVEPIEYEGQGAQRRNYQVDNETVLAYRFDYNVKSQAAIELNPVWIRWGVKDCEGNVLNVSLVKQGVGGTFEKKLEWKCKETLGKNDEIRAKLGVFEPDSSMKVRVWSRGAQKPQVIRRAPSEYKGPLYDALMWLSNFVEMLYDKLFWWL